MQATCKRRTALTQKSSELQTWLLCCPFIKLSFIKVSVQEMWEMSKVKLRVPRGGKDEGAFRISHLLLETLESWGDPFEMGGSSLGRLCVKLPSICLQKQKTRWNETHQGREISFICTMPSSWLQPALCTSATMEPTLAILLQAFPSQSITQWLLICREPGTRSWVYCPSSVPHMHIHTALV